MKQTNQPTFPKCVFMNIHVLSPSMTKLVAKFEERLFWKSPKIFQPNFVLLINKLSLLKGTLG